MRFVLFAILRKRTIYEACNLVIVIFFVCFTSNLTLYAQAQYFSGTVIDADSKEPIPYAHIQILSSGGQGTITDAKGKCLIRKQPGWLDVIKVRVSFLGYRSEEADIFLAEKATILLKKDVHKLPEVKISGGDYERDLLRRVIAKIPENYPLYNERIMGRVTEKGFLDTLNAGPLYSAWAITAADKQDYGLRRGYGNVAVLEGKVDTFPAFAETDFRIIAGVYNIHRFDVVHLRLGPLREAKLQTYDFSRKEMMYFDDEPVLPIDFKSQDMSGTLYINMNDTALHGIEARAEPGAFNSFGRGLELNSRRRHLTFETGYAKYGDRYRLKYVHYNTAFDRVGDGKRFFLENTYAITSFEKASSPIPEVERTEFREKLIDLVPLTVSTTSDSLEAEPQDLTTNWFDRALERLTMDLGYFGMQLNSNAFAYAASESEIHEVLSGQFPSQSQYREGLAAQFSYRINHRFSVVLNTAGLFSQSYGLNVAGIKVNKTLGFTGKWAVSGAFTAGMETFNREIADIGNSSEYEALRPHIQFENTSMTYRTESFVIAPIFSISYAPRKLISFIISAIYISQFHSSNMLVFQNEDFSWPWQQSTYAVAQPGGNPYSDRVQLQVRVVFGSR